MLFHGFFSVSCEPYHPDAATTDHYTFRENSFADLRIDSPKLIGFCQRRPLFGRFKGSDRQTR